MPRDFAVGHRNYLEAFGVPLSRLLDRLLRSGDYWRVFSEGEQQQIVEFSRLIDRKNVPMALVKVEQRDEPILLLDEENPSYDARATARRMANP